VDHSHEQPSDEAEAQDESKDDDGPHTGSLASEYEEFGESVGNVEHEEMGEEYVLE